LQNYSNFYIFHYGKISVDSDSEMNFAWLSLYSSRSGFRILWSG